MSKCGLDGGSSGRRPGAELPRAPRVDLRRHGETCVAVAERSGKTLRDEGPSAPATDDQTRGREIAIGLGDRVRGDVQLGGEVADRRHPFAGRQTSRGDPRRERGAKLLGQRFAGRRVEPDPHRIHHGCSVELGCACTVSPMTVRVGVGLFTGQLPADSPRTFAQEYREMLELVRVAESAGFDSAWVSEHHGASDGYLPSLLPMLAAFAASTETILLGTGIVLAPFHDPLRLAEDAAVVDQLSGGRLLLGLGIGWREEEFRMFGVPRSERAIRTEETIEILRRAWTGRRFSFEGRAFRYDRVKVTPPPARASGIPVYLGGYADKAVRRAGRLADGYVADAARDDTPRHVAIAEDS